MKNEKLTKNEIQLLINAFYESPSAESLKKIPEYKQQRGMVEFAVKKDGLSLQYVKEKFIDQELCDIAFEQNPDAIRFIPERYISVEQCYIALRYKSYNFKDVPKKFISSKMCMKAIECNGVLLEFVPEGLVNKEMCITAVKNNGIAIQFVDDQFMDQEICDIAIKESMDAFPFIPPRFMNKALCTDAFNYNTDYLQYIPKKYHTASMIATALEKNGSLLKDVDDELKTPELCEIAVGNDIMAVQYVPKSMFSIDLASKALEGAISKSNELLYDPFSLIPEKYLDDNLILNFYERYHKKPEIIPVHLLSTESLISAIKINRNIYKYIPRQRQSKELKSALLSTGNRAIDMINRNSMNDELYYEAFKYDHEAIMSIPRNHITIEMWCIFLGDYIQVKLDDVMRKMNPDYLQNTIIVDALIKHFGFPKVMEWQNKKVSSNSKNPIMIDPKIFSLFENAYRKESFQYDLSLSDTIEEVPKILLPQVSDNQIVHYTNDMTVNLRKVYYISDIHLEHQIKEVYKNNSGILEDIKPYIEEKIKEMLPSYNDSLQEDEYILVAGDVAHSYSLTRLFYNTLLENWKGSVIGVLGNHELWDSDNDTTGMSNSNVDSIINQYSIRSYSMLRTAAILENSLYIKYQNFEHRILSEEKILSYNDWELREILRDSSLIILGGNGYSGNNPVYNAKKGLYRNTITTISEEKALTERFYKIYQIIKECASDMIVIVLTHTPFTDWAEGDYVKKWIYINGHTHNNKIVRTSDGTTVLSDNQVGYEPKKWHLNCVMVYGQYDVFKYMSDGIKEVSSERYKDFMQGKGITLRGLDVSGTIYALKRDKKYMFIAKQDDKLYLLEGGKRRGLDSISLQYYYDNMNRMADILRRALMPYREELAKLSKAIMSVGGSGRVHGCIIDIGCYTHMWFDPTNGKLEAYLAFDSSDYEPYDLHTLLKMFEPRINIQFEEAIKNKALPLLSNYELINEDEHYYLSELVVNDVFSRYREKRDRSRIMRSIQYLLDDNIVRYWNDELLSKDTGSNMKLLN